MNPFMQGLLKSAENKNKWAHPSGVTGKSLTKRLFTKHDWDKGSQKGCGKHPEAKNWRGKGKGQWLTYQMPEPHLVEEACEQWSLKRNLATANMRSDLTILCPLISCQCLSFTESKQRPVDKKVWWYIHKNHLLGIGVDKCGERI